MSCWVEVHTLQEDQEFWGHCHLQNEFKELQVAWSGGEGFDFSKRKPSVKGGAGAVSKLDTSCAFCF